MLKPTILAAIVLILGLASVATAQNPVSPDNSGVNSRDRNSGAMTAGQQSNASTDVELTRKIRRAVVNDSSLSTLAHNVKIITANGSVTLRGPVKSEHERDAISSKAQSIAGVRKVNNQLEVRNQ